MDRPSRVLPRNVIIRLLSHVPFYYTVLVDFQDLFNSYYGKRADPHGLKREAAAEREAIGLPPGGGGVTGAARTVHPPTVATILKVVCMP